MASEVSINQTPAFGRKSPQHDDMYSILWPTYEVMYTKYEVNWTDSYGGKIWKPKNAQTEGPMMQGRKDRWTEGCKDARREPS